MSKAATATSDLTALTPTRIAALRRWLSAANLRLVAVQRDRQQLVASASALAKGFEPAGKPPRLKRPRLLSRLAKAG
jgi:hypothetical protein